MLRALGVAAALAALTAAAGCNYRDYESPMQDNFVRWKANDEAYREELPSELNRYWDGQKKLLPVKKKGDS